MLLPGVAMEGLTATDREIREVIKKAPISKIETAISEYIHDRRNQEIARRKIIDGEPYEPLSEYFRLTPGQVKNIIRQARRIIYEHLE